MPYSHMMPKSEMAGEPKVGDKVSFSVKSVHPEHVELHEPMHENSAVPSPVLEHEEPHTMKPAASNSKSSEKMSLAELRKATTRKVGEVDHYGDPVRD